MTPGMGNHLVLAIRVYTLTVREASRKAAGCHNRGTEADTASQSCWFQNVQRDYVLASGFDGYLAKPIDPEAFANQIEVFLPR